MALLATGQFLKAELYEITLSNTNVYRYTTAQVPLTVGGNVYGTQLLITRDVVTSGIGLEVQGLSLTLAPRNDHPGGAVLLEGFPFLSAITARTLDAARVKMSKVFTASWDDMSQGAVLWFQGRVSGPVIGRFSCDLNVNSDTEMLNVSMPRNVIQAGCVHTLFDAGCTLSKASFTTSGTVSGTPTVLAFNSNLTQANAYFDLGTVKFTSGANANLSRTIKGYLNASGAVTVIRPFPTPPANGDTFTIVPTCRKTQAACSNTNAALGAPFNNLTHFRGKPYVPVPETLYGGGVSSGSAPATPGGQGGPRVGSPLSGQQGAGTYKP
jgi:uncharacterized phage protein (TIGR02218 family)